MSKDDSSPLTRDIAPFGVRMPPDLKERVAVAAKSNNRSMNAEIVSTLDEKYPANLFDLEEFVTRLSPRLHSTQDPEKIGDMVAEANRDLKEKGIDLRVHSSVGADGKFVYIVMQTRPANP